jgi:hypothetical protein
VIADGTVVWEHKDFQDRAVWLWEILAEVGLSSLCSSLRSTLRTIPGWQGIIP